MPVAPASYNAEAICACPGLDGVMVGAADLALSLGLFGAHAYLARAYFPAERVVAEVAR